MMSLEPHYGSTPLPLDEVDYLEPAIRDTLPQPITQGDVYFIEKQLELHRMREIFPQVLAGQLGVRDLVTSEFFRFLHSRLYEGVWSWSGKWRRHEINIGVAPEEIQVELRNSCDSLVYRWENTDDWSARELGIAVHAEVVRVHPFVDGNGCSSRFVADLVFVAAQAKRVGEVYNWDIDKRRYIELLRSYDITRDPTALAEFVPLLTSLPEKSLP